VELGECNAIVRQLQNESNSFYRCEMKKFTALYTVKMLAEFENSYSDVFFANINKHLKT